jgi:hypothetical protein
MSVRSMPAAHRRCALGSSRWSTRQRVDTRLSRHCATNRRNTACQLDSGKPWRVQPMVCRRGTEIPKHRVALAKEYLVRSSRPLADVRARDVTDVVLVERSTAPSSGRVSTPVPFQSLTAKPGKVVHCSQSTAIVAPRERVHWRVHSLVVSLVVATLSSDADGPCSSRNSNCLAHLVPRSPIIQGKANVTNSTSRCLRVGRTGALNLTITTCERGVTALLSPGTDAGNAVTRFGGVEGHCPAGVEAHTVSRPRDRAGGHGWTVPGE